MTLWLSPEALPLVVEEVIPDIEGQDPDDPDDLGQCPECGADLFFEGCPCCQSPTDD